MSERATEVLTERPPGERERQDASALKAAIAGLLADQKQKWEEQVTREVEALRVPDRSEVPSGYERPQAHRGSISMSSPWDPYYRRLPEDVRAIRNPDTDHWIAEEARGMILDDRVRIFQAQTELNALTRTDTVEGIAAASGAYSTGTGGTVVSRPMEELILIAKDNVSKTPALAAALNMVKQTHTLPTGKAMTTYQTAEGGTTTQGEPTYSAVQLSAVKTGARAVLSDEIVDDADANLAAFMTVRAGSAIGAAQEAQYWRTGDGTPPNISAFVAGVTYTPSATATSLDYTSVLGMYFTLPEAYLGNAAWYVEKGVLQLMAKVRDGQGRPFYQGITERPAALDDQVRAVGAILGHPVYRVDATAGTIHFGDLNALYTIGTRQGITAKKSEHAQFAAGLVEFKWEQRYDGNNVDTSAAQTATGITVANSL